MNDIYALMSGGIAVGCWVAGLFFLRFGRKTHDRLFYIFGVAFWMLSAERIIPITLGIQDENRTSVYLVRLLAFALILFAVIDKNRRGSEQVEE